MIKNIFVDPICIYAICESVRMMIIRHTCVFRAMKPSIDQRYAGIVEAATKLIGHSTKQSRHKEVSAGACNDFSGAFEQAQANEFEVIPIRSESRQVDGHKVPAWQFNETKLKAAVT